MEQRATHLLVLIHGWMGDESDLEELERALYSRAARSDRAVAVRRVRLRGRATRGVRDAAADVERVVKRARQELPFATDVSVVGHSFGGLVARHALAAGAFDGLRPKTFLSTASPHLSVAPALPILPFVPHGVASFVSRRLLGRSAAELMLADGGGEADAGGETNAPLLVEMATQERYLAPLRGFERRVCFANAANDTLVAYGTAALRTDVPTELRKFSVWRGEARVVREEVRLPEDAPRAHPPAAYAGTQLQQYRSAMEAGLRSVGAWHEVDVLVPSMLVPAAHPTICAKPGPFRKRGIPIVEHQAAMLLPDDDAPGPS